MRLFAPAAIALLLAAPTMAAPNTVSSLYYEDLWGAWEVTGVQVADTPVQALVKDDPQYMGASLKLASDEIRWVDGTETRPVDPADLCLDPSFTEQGKDYAVLCGGKPWGPDAVLSLLTNDTISFTWYDGATLILTRSEYGSY